MRMKFFFATAMVLALALQPACTPKIVQGVVGTLALVPFADRTEKEINEWFQDSPIIDDKPFTSGTAVNGDPKVILINKGPLLSIGGTNYPGAICIAQVNGLPGGQSLKYAALAGVTVLNNTTFFEVGKMALGTQSCDGDPMAVNVAAFHDQQELETKFRAALNNWLQDDIAKTLKSTTNKEGLANPASAQPRSPATVRGHLYGVTEDPGPPVVRSIGFVAE